MKKNNHLEDMISAIHYASFSTCKKRKVGCIVVKNKIIISRGCNKTPEGWEDVYEDENNVTFQYVYHAETVALSKLAKSTESSEGATLFVTTEPCYNCSKLIVQCGIVKVFYYENHPERSGVGFLLKAGVRVFNFVDAIILPPTNDDSRDFYTEITL